MPRNTNNWVSWKTWYGTQHPPTKPAIPTTKAETWAYKTKKKIYKRHTACDKEVVHYLSKKFLDSKQNALGAFPINYTALLAI